MSDPKPDRILAEESDNPWVKLILWAHEDSVRGTERWNGFIKYLVEERLDTDSAAFKSALPLSGEALEHAKNFFPNNADFKKDQLVITIENHIFSEELNFNGAIFAHRSVLRIVVSSAALIFIKQISNERPGSQALNFWKLSISETLNSALLLSSKGSLFVERLFFIGRRMNLIC